jgi:chromosome segregation ATPase
MDPADNPAAAEEETASNHPESENQEDDSPEEPEPQANDPESPSPEDRSTTVQRTNNQTTDVGSIEEQQEQLNNDEAARESAFKIIQEEFNQMMQELGSESGLQKFRSEYEKLFQALQKTRDSEKSLSKMCRDLNDELVSSATRVQNAMKMSQNDRAVIASLKKEIKNAWQMVEAAQEKEAAAKDTIDQLKAEVATLHSTLQQSTGKIIIKMISLLIFNF